MILRPYGIVIEGRLELGLELVRRDDGKNDLRPHTGVPDSYVLSPAFFNAHSHLEYRGMVDLYGSTLPYWPWIRELTKQKRWQNLEDVERDVKLAAAENRLTGVKSIWEHSDRPFAAKAMQESGLGGVIFQELITFLEQESPNEKRAQVEALAEEQRLAAEIPVYVSPHSPFTVDQDSLTRIGQDNAPFSIHVAETEFESQFFREGIGPIADLYRSAGFNFEAFGSSVFDYVESLGLMRKNAQFVHVCDVKDSDIYRMAAAGVRVAHCPRSNRRLGSPTCPVKRMLEAGIELGLGMDSPASSGSIDMFDEMRACLRSSVELGEPIKPEQVWAMATSGQTEWIQIHIEDARTTEELIERAKPSLVEWVSDEIAVGT